MFNNKFSIGILRHPGYNDVGSAISAGASLLGGALGDDAAEGASGAQSEAAARAIEEIRKIGDRTRSDTTPYRDLGGASADRLSYLLGLGGGYGTNADGSGYGNLFSMVDGVPSSVRSIYENDPAYRKAWDEVQKLHNARYAGGYTGDSDTNWIDQQVRARLPAGGNTGDGKYGSLLRSFGLGDLNKDVVYNTGLQFGLDEGNKAIERNATRFGNLDSGATLKALSRFGNDYGTTKAQGAYDRFMGDKTFTMNSLLGTTGVGQNAVALDAQTGANMAQAIGGANMAQGNAQAAGQIGSANAWSGALGGVANALGGGARGGSFGSIFGGNGSVGGRTNAVPGAYYA